MHAGKCLLSQVLFDPNVVHWVLKDETNKSTSLLLKYNKVGLNREKKTCEVQSFIICLWLGNVEWAPSADQAGDFIVFESILKTYFFALAFGIVWDADFCFVILLVFYSIAGCVFKVFSIFCIVIFFVFGMHFLFFMFCLVCYTLVPLVR